MIDIINNKSNFFHKYLSRNQTTLEEIFFFISQVNSWKSDSYNSFINFCSLILQFQTILNGSVQFSHLWSFLKYIMFILSVNYTGNQVITQIKRKMQTIDIRELLNWSVRLILFNSKGWNNFFLISFKNIPYIFNPLLSYK